MSDPRPTPTAISPDFATIPRQVEGRPNLFGLTRDGMLSAMADLGVPEKQRKMRAGQLWQWIYQKGVSDFDAMTNLSRKLRERLQEIAEVRAPEVVECSVTVSKLRGQRIDRRHLIIPS